MIVVIFSFHSWVVNIQSKPLPTSRVSVSLRLMKILKNLTSITQRDHRVKLTSYALEMVPFFHLKDWWSPEVFWKNFDLLFMNKIKLITNTY